MNDRTLVLTNDFPPRSGGIETYVAELLARLDPARLVVHACAPERGQERAAAEHDASLPYPVVRDPARLLLPGPGLAARAGDTARRFGARSVWFPSAAPLGLLAQSLASAGIRRSVASAHGHEVWWSRLPVTRLAMRRLGSSVDVVTFDSDAVRRPIAAGLGGLGASRMVRLAPGVDSDRFAAGSAATATAGPGATGTGSSGLGAGGPVVLCVSRLVPRKGHGRLLTAWPEVLRAHPDARLLLAGGGPEEARLRRRARGLTSVQVLGAVPAPDLPALYASADLFVLPVADRAGGLVTESLGIVLLEAAAAGVPVVSGRAGGTTEAVLDGRSGVLLDGRDVSEVARAVSSLLADPELSARLGRTGQQWVRRSWTWDASAARLGRLLAGEPVQRWE